MPFVDSLRCRECSRTYPVEALHVCEFCFGPLEVAYDYERIAASVTREKIAAGPTTIWRYADLLPASAENPVNLGAGFTPLVRADRLAAAGERILPFRVDGYTWIDIGRPEQLDEARRRFSTP